MFLLYEIRGGLPCAAKQVLCGDPVARAVEDAMAKARSVGELALGGKVRFSDDALNQMLGVVAQAEIMAAQLKAEADKAFKACIDSMTEA